MTGDHHSALKTFTRLEKKVKPNVESYSLMIKTIAKAMTSFASSRFFRPGSPS